jgi:acyl dehydratase
MPEPTELSFAELGGWVGREFGPTDWLDVAQERVDRFAEATGDDQWIHVDVDRAADGPFGGTVAHGFLTLSLIPVLQRQLWRVTGTRMAVNYGLGKVRFPSAVRVGSRVRMRSQLLELSPRPDGGALMTTQATIELEGADKPACVAESLALLVP